MAAVVSGAASDDTGAKPKPGAKGKGELGKKYAGLPLWAWGLGAGLVVGGLYLLRKKAAASSSSTGTPTTYTPTGAPVGGGGSGGGDVLPGGGSAPGTNPGTSTAAVGSPGASSQPADGGQVATSYALPAIGSQVPGFGTVLNAEQGTGPQSAPSDPSTLGAWNAALGTPPQAIIGGPGSSVSKIAGGEYDVYGGGVQGTGAPVAPSKRIAGERYDTSGRVIL